MKVNHPTYYEWPWTISSRSSHSLCRSQSRARNNMYIIKLIFIAQEHLTMNKISFQNCTFLSFMACDFGLYWPRGLLHIVHSCISYHSPLADRGYIFIRGVVCLTVYLSILFLLSPNQSTGFSSAWFFCQLVWAQIVSGLSFINENRLHEINEYR